jgi:copper oxidase (laccase) domain-containing protein
MPENIDSQPLCSHCHDEFFFSYRRDGSVEGRMAAIIATGKITPAL